MSRLVIVSNRVADVRNATQSGGLAVAVGAAIRERGGVWFGWDGSVVEDADRAGPTVDEQGPVTVVTLPLSEAEYEGYYLGYANQSLWPVFHYRLDLAEFDLSFTDAYRRVNRRFATHLRETVNDDDMIWVHDYHLIPLASELRAREVGNKIGFFLHIPFPPPDVLVAMPDHDWLVRCLFSYDLVGFQTRLDVANFHRYIREYAAGEVGKDGSVTAYGRTIVARNFPIGIDAEDFAAMARSEKAREHIEILHRRTLARSLIIGVERLDYSKGLPERFKVFRRLLERYPEHRKGATLMQIAAPTREDVEAYTDIRDELEMLSGAINGRFGDFDWTPVRYIHRSVPRATLAALYRGCQVGLVTPLRDGMNLVAKEYVAAQDPTDPGVLVLSKFAGAAEELDEALIVNPYDIDEVVDALQRALTMRLEERQERHGALWARVKAGDANHWCKSFLDTLRRSTVRIAA